MKTSVEIPDSLFQEARKVAHRDRTTLKVLIEEGLRKIISECKRRRGFRLRKATFKGNGLQPHLSGVSSDFWDTHDLSDFWDKTKSVDFDVNIESEITYYSLDKRLAEEVQSIAQRRGVSADTLINLWVQEKIQEQNR